MIARVSAELPPILKVQPVAAVGKQSWVYYYLLLREGHMGSLGRLGKTGLGGACWRVGPGLGDLGEGQGSRGLDWVLLGSGDQTILLMSEAGGMEQQSLRSGRRGRLHFWETLFLSLLGCD